MLPHQRAGILGPRLQRSAQAPIARGTQRIAQCHRHLRGMPPHIDIAYGALLMGNNGKAEHLLNRTMHRAYNTFLSDMGVPFPATFIRVPVLQRERFDASYKIAGDFEFVARILSGDNVARLPIIVSYMEMGGLSSDSSNCTLLEERLRALYAHIAPKAREIMETSINHVVDNDDSLEAIPD